MYLVAYIIACYDMSVKDACHQIKVLLLAERNMELDRDKRFLPIVESMVND
jgi:hypothetical protein